MFINFPNFLAPRFQDEMEEMAWDMGLPAGTSAEDIHAALKVRAEELSHAQEACCLQQKQGE